MNETRTTAMLSGIAVALAVTTWATRPRPAVSDLFADRGQPLFPGFRNSDDARSLEVMEFDSANGRSTALKILNREGRWTIPSHFDYPADAGARVADIAAAFSTARKDDVVTDAAGDHGRFEVLDPADVSAADTGGKGTRIVITGENDRILADLIVGGKAEGRAGFRYVRLPRQNRVYLTRASGLDASAAFEHWIDRDVLQVRPADIDELVIRNYSVDERSGAVNPRETSRLHRRSDDQWTLVDGQYRAPANRRRISDLLAQLVALRIVGVLPKPAGLTATLNRTAPQQRISDDDVRDLARKGFYLGAGGELFANEGELVVHTRSGTFYTLRFGQVAHGVDVPADAGDGEHRYLFVTAAYDPSTASAHDPHAAESQKRVNVLHARFAPWYYIISAADFSTLRPRRADLVNE